jgi:hypothetical protein
MAVQRIKINVNKKSAQLKYQKREIATLLGEQKIEKVRLFRILSVIISWMIYLIAGKNQS